MRCFWKKTAVRGNRILVSTECSAFLVEASHLSQGHPAAVIGALGVVLLRRVN
ncbi:Uncharacterised protein [Bordetella trematum]|uniref:Uncharacterized protein n=1 Tax=Bordetella trematum TaxID=123899 RepID=A0A157S0I8_9BORD|nr:Uncharacterised protein [Bordetella trematum]SAI63229.1 Uncharacterised protein [Bordetella trematum]SAI69058.1 Uncharacterised protein [Bordetella trematum]SUV99426.1 Uncharacterised protein [Bordetella trematum]